MKTNSFDSHNEKENEINEFMGKKASYIVQLIGGSALFASFFRLQA